MSSIEALELLRANLNQFVLIITDLTLPQKTGDEIAKEIMSIRPDIVIILYTGFSGRIAEEKVRAVDIKAFLVNPVLMSEIVKTISGC